MGEDKFGKAKKKFRRDGQNKRKWQKFQEKKELNKRNRFKMEDLI